MNFKTHPGVGKDPGCFGRNPLPEVNLGTAGGAAWCPPSEVPLR